jgi:hypothetical protein
MRGKSAKIVENVETVNGMLYKGSEVTIVEVVCKCQGKNNIKIEDATGRIYWVTNRNILII